MVSEAVRPFLRHGVRVVDRVQTVAFWIAAVSLAVLTVFTMLNL